jgi:hypothetical protein
VHSFFHEGHHVHLIDTPGFDDTNHSDIDTLKAIATYLSASFANGVRLSGIVYLHRISDNRISGTGFRNLRMFKKLSGATTWPNTVIGTTMWRADELIQGETREKELISNPKYFGDLLLGGATLHRIAEHGTGADEQKRSSLRVISSLLQRTLSSPQIELRIQRELVLDRLALDATAAGKEAEGDLSLLRCNLNKQIENTRKDMQDAMRARDAESVKQLQTMQRETAKKLSEAQTRQDELKTSLMEMHDREVQKLSARLDEMDTQQRNLLKIKQQELDDMEGSLRLMREQAAIDEARWRQQALNAAEWQRRQLAQQKWHWECQQNVVASKQIVVQEQQNLGAVTQAKKAVRSNVVNGTANGISAGAVTAMTSLCRLPLSNLYQT